MIQPQNTNNTGNQGNANNQGSVNNQNYPMHYPMMNNSNGYPIMSMPVMNREAETEKVKHIVNEIYECQKDAIEFHQSMVDMFDFLHLRGFKTWQEYRVKEETEKMQDIQHMFIKRRQSMLGPHRVQQYSSIIPPEMYTHTTREISRDDISRETKRILKEYMKWEEKTLEFYKKKMRELMEIESYAEYIDIRELIDDVVAEIEFLQNTMVELESVGYDASYIQKVQERFQTEFGMHSKGRRYYDEQKKWSRLDY